MKITFQNLGTIRRTEIELRPLTVIIGPNNTSKTYVAYSIYGLWSSFGSLRPRLGDGVSTLTDVEQAVKLLIEMSVERFQRELGRYFHDRSGKLFGKTLYEVHPSPEEIREAIRRSVDLSAPTPKPDEPISPTKEALGIIWELLAALALKSLFHEPFLLPAERNGLVLTYKVLGSRRFKLLRDARPADLSSSGDDGVRYPKPVEDFLDFLTDVEIADAPLLNPQGSPFHALADEIERAIQNKHKTRLVPNVVGGKDIKVEIKRGLVIDLHNASSSIKQLAPLLLFLRYRARRGGFLIIDEPEMNLHPESQAKLLEALAILVNLGVRVLITTHSPYFMAHLNNLVSAHPSDALLRQEQAAHLYMRDARAFLRVDQVGAYEMKSGELRSLKDPSYGVRWDTLSDPSGDIQQAYFSIQGVMDGKEGKG